MRRLLFLAVLPIVLLCMLAPPPSAALAAPADLPPPDLLQLPFPIGATWTFNGVHGPRMDAIDFSVGRPWPRWGADTREIWVVAAAPGVIRKTSSCGFEIDHADGWTTVYYHVANILRDSGTVQANERLANIAGKRRAALCEGGSATAPHLHFGLKHYGAEVPIDGLTLSGWRVHSGSSRYDSNCARMYLSRGDEKMCPYDSPLINEGSMPASASAQAAPGAAGVSAGLAAYFAGQSPPSQQSSLQVDVDAPAANDAVRGQVVICGWALDRAAQDGTGVDHVHVYLDGPAGQGAFVGEASYGADRPDLASAFGAARFRPAGYALAWDASRVAPGAHTLFVYAHGAAAGWSYTTRAVTVSN